MSVVTIYPLRTGLIAAAAPCWPRRSQNMHLLAWHSIRNHICAVAAWDSSVDNACSIIWSMRYLSGFRRYGFHGRGKISD
jgi:hypothetical protein